MDSGGWIEIIFLAMLAGFIGLRLYNVLGRRTGHEKPIGEPLRPTQAQPLNRPSPVAERDNYSPIELPAGIEPALRPGLEAVMRADKTFAPEQFVRGAQGAYSMILEAFWRGDLSPVDGFVADDVLQQFRQAVEARGGVPVDNRLIRIDDASIVDARMNGTMAEVTVRFVAVIVASGQEATTRDLWTFSRLTASADPNWLLIATDEEE